MSGLFLFGARQEFRAAAEVHLRNGVMDVPLNLPKVHPQPSKGSPPTFQRFAPDLPKVRFPPIVLALGAIRVAGADHDDHATRVLLEAALACFGWHDLSVIIIIIIRRRRTRTIIIIIIIIIIVVVVVVVVVPLAALLEDVPVHRLVPGRGDCRVHLREEVELDPEHDPVLLLCS